MLYALFNAGNYSINLFALPTFLAAIVTVSLGLIVLIGERRSTTSVSFFVMTLTAAAWLLSYAAMYCASNDVAAEAWARAGHLGITLIPAAVYSFTVHALRLYSHERRRLGLAWLASAIFTVTIYTTDFFVAGVYLYDWGYYARYSWFSVVFLAFFFALMALSLRRYWHEFHAASATTLKLRSKALFVAFSVAYLGSFDYLPAFGVPVYPVGYLAVLGFVTLTARAVWRYRLIDITPAFAAGEIVNAMADALLVLDNEGVVRVANRTACALFGRSGQNLVGAAIQTLTSGLTAPDTRLDRLILSGSLRDFETPLAIGSGNPITVSVSCTAMLDSDARPVAFVCILRDITEQKKAREEIQSHLQRLAALYELNLATTSTLELRAILDLLLDKLTALVPDTAITIMLRGGDDRELVKVACRGIDQATWKSAGNREAAAVHPVIAKKEAVFISDLRAQNDGLEAEPFGKAGFVSYFGVPLIEKNRVLGILSFYCRAARRFSDPELHFLKSLAGQAAAAIGNSQLYEQTRSQAIALEKASKVKDEFLSVMSHELRTPLNVISGYTKLVQDGMLGNVNPEQLNALEKVSRHSNEMLVMVNSIMDATKIESGAIKVDYEDFPLPEFLIELGYLYEYPLPKSVVLKWDYAPGLPVIQTDRDKLKHILQNLINNALKFTETGHVTVSARHFPASDTIEFAVSDTGVGIVSEDLPLIFDKFRQIDSSRTRSRGGVGLGLHIVKTFVQLLGGSVRASSELGKGSVFTVTLPRLYPQGVSAHQDVPLPLF